MTFCNNFVGRLQQELLTNGSPTPIYLGSLLGTRASELWVNADNINQNLSRYFSLLGEWDSCGFTYTGATGWTAVAEGGYTSNCGRAWPRCWYSCGTSDIDENSRYGYLSTFVGGVGKRSAGVGTTFNQQITPSGLTSELIDVYGHGAPTWPLTLNDVNQYRNPTSLPVDGSAVVTTTGSTFSRDKGLYPCWYMLHITSTGAVGSGNVKFIFEQVPTTRTWNLYQSTTELDNSFRYTTDWWGSTLSRRDYEILMAQWMGFQSFITAVTYDMHITNKHSDGSGVTPCHPDYDFINGTSTIDRYLGWRPFDCRIRDRAVFAMTNEYFGMVMYTYVMIFSTKSGLLPVQVYNLKNTFTGTNRRIAGVSWDPVGETLYALSEDGELARIDFSSVSGGSVSLTNSAPALPLGHRYACLKRDPITGRLWALGGLYALHAWELSEQGTPGISVTDFNPGTNTWGVRRDSGSLNGRVGGRSLNQMVIANNKLVILADKVVSSTTNIPLLYYSHYNTWNSTSKSLSAIIPSISPLRGCCIRTGDPKSMVKVGIRRDGSWAAGDTLTQLIIKRASGYSVSGDTYLESQTVQWSGANTLDLGSGSYAYSDPVALTFSNQSDYYLYVTTNSNLATRNRRVPAGMGFQYYAAPPMGETTVSEDFRGFDSNVSFDNLYLDQIVFDSATDVYFQEVEADTSACWKYQLITFDLGTSNWVSKEDVGFYAPVRDSNYFSGFACMPGKSSSASDYRAHSSQRGILESPNLIPHGGTVVVQLNMTYNAMWFYKTGTDELFRILPGSAPNAGTSASVAPNLTEGSTLIQLGNLMTSSPTPPYPRRPSTLYQIPAGYAWPSADVNLTSFRAILSRADGTKAKDQTVSYAPFGVGLNSTFFLWTFLLHHTDFTYFGFGPHVNGAPTAMYPGGSMMGVGYLPRYWFWNGSAWASTSSWDEAVASPYSVSTTPGQDIDLIDGLRVQFGPTAGSTFASGEYHSLNVTYGKVKYVRKARYTQALFAGKTLRNSETKTMDSQRAMTRSRYMPTAISSVNITSPTYATNNYCRWPKRNGAAWNPDCNSGVYPRLVFTLGGINFSDIWLGTYMARGITWEVSTDGGVSYVPILPVWRSQKGNVWVFARQEGVTHVRLTARVPQNLDGTQFELGNVSFWDWGTQAQIDAARMGNQALPDGDPGKVSWDPMSVGLAHNMVVAIDGASPMINYHYIGTDPLTDFYTYNTAIPANNYRIHPYFGFILFEGAGLQGVQSTKPGTNVSVSYHWGRRV